MWLDLVNMCSILHLSFSFTLSSDNIYDIVVILKHRYMLIVRFSPIVNFCFLIVQLACAWNALLSNYGIIPGGVSYDFYFHLVKVLLRNCFVT